MEIRRFFCNFAKNYNTMKLLVRRTALKDTYTIGKLYVDGEYFCDTLEDRVRDLSKEAKVAGQTAIPEGTYIVSVTMSPRFGRLLPLLHDVPQFTGVRIHSGNTARDTEGCILVGYNREKGKVLDSRKTETRLVNLMIDRHENIEITIRNY